MSSSDGRSDPGNEEDHFDANPDQSDADTDHFDQEGDSTSTVMEEDEAGRLAEVNLVGLIQLFL
jgi:hypothetical protein